MPSVMIMSRLCPRGLEATMFALLASASNLGSNISNYSGAFLLDVLGVRPNGGKNESDQFENLWLTLFLTPVQTTLDLSQESTSKKNRSKTDKEDTESKEMKGKTTTRELSLLTAMMTMMSLLDL